MKLYYDNNLIGELTINHSIDLDSLIHSLNHKVANFFGQAEDWDALEQPLNTDGEFIYDYDLFRMEP